ncbi:MAG: phosphopyruvate hydratase [Hespellia sp.]|nr:phosphopyruvate hydratase [Hespellia sp.]
MQTVIPITDVYAREILDSRGNPTIEVEILAGEKYMGRAAVPSGASTGKFEAVELRDGGKRYHGKGVQKAVDHVNNELAKEIIGCNVLDQGYIDKVMIQADGTENKGGYGANAILGISMAAARAAASALRLPLYRYIGGMHEGKMPVPMMNVINGGVHAANTLDIQEFMIMPVGAEDFKEGLRMCAEIYQELKRLLGAHGLSTAVGDEGGFAPDLPDTKEALKFLSDAVKAAGYELEQDIVFAMDVAASELYDSDFKKYVFPGESRMQGHQVIRSAEELIEYYEDLASEFPICSIEDPLDEEDWEGWKKITELLGDEIQLVGDDLFVTNVRRLKKGISAGAANAILIKVNQIGTLSEAVEAINMAKKAGYRTIISHRSGETEDTFIADLAVAVDARQIKTGAPCRAERVAKYNQLLRIEEQLEQ